MVYKGVAYEESYIIQPISLGVKYKNVVGRNKFARKPFIENRKLFGNIVILQKGMSISRK